MAKPKGTRNKTLEEKLADKEMEVKKAKETYDKLRKEYSSLKKEFETRKNDQLIKSIREKGISLDKIQEYVDSLPSERNQGLGTEEEGEE